MQTTDAYLWPAAVSILDTRKETWWEILLLFCGSNRNKSDPGANFSAASLSAIMMHQGKQPVVISVHLSVCPQHEGGDTRAPELHRADPPAPCDAPSPPCSALQRPGWRRKSRCAAGGEPRTNRGFFHLTFRDGEGGARREEVQVEADDDETQEEAEKRRVGEETKVYHWSL